MPIEIRELIIKATVVQESGAVGATQTGSGSGNNDASPNEELIKTCVEKVLEIIKEKNGR
jgi:hypothetical protein